MVAENVSQHGIETPPPVVMKKRGRGRPKGSKNKPKFGLSPTEQAPQRKPGWDIDIRKGFKTSSTSYQRKWQRGWVLPQFVLNRKQAQEILIKYLRSKPGKQALTSIITDGFVGTAKLADNKLGEFLVSTNLLSRYPHEIVIRGN